MKQLKQIEEFQTIFGTPPAKLEDNFPFQRRKIRLALALEELTELAQAMGLEGTFRVMLKNTADELIDDTNVIDKTAILDALCDIQVVNLGTACESGLNQVFEASFNEVHRSNMSKVCNTLEIAMASVAKYHRAGIETDYRSVGEKFVIYNKDTNKILKSIEYSAPNLQQFIEKRVILDK
jgi:predicted HAD superfamily Cof-like phosphohydrolase